MKKRLAIIDDEATFLKLLSTLLEQEGYEAELFEQSDSSAAAYEKVREFVPDIIVLDIAMDQPATGWKTLNLLKLDPVLSTKPVVVCSNNLQHIQDSTWYLKTKGCAVLPKPYYLSDLLDILGQLETEQL